MTHGMIDPHSVSGLPPVASAAIRAAVGLLVLLNGVTTADAGQQIPTVGGADARPFHHVIAVGEKEQILGVLTGPNSVLWVVAPSQNEAHALRIKDTETDPAPMTVQANAVRFDASKPVVSEIWKHTGRQVLWNDPVPVGTGLKLALGDKARIGIGYKVTLAWTPPNWKARVWTKEEEDPNYRIQNVPAQAPGAAAKTTVTLDQKSIAVEHSYQLKKGKSGLVAEVRLTAEGRESETFTLPFVTEQKVQDVIERKGKVERSWEVCAVSAHALDCVPIDDRTMLVVSRPQLLRAALMSTFAQLQDQMVMAATQARPPYGVFRSFERAFRAATLLAALAELDLSAEEQKAVRLSLANATLFFRNLHLWTSTVPADLPAGATRELLIFFPKGAAEHRCAPTHALLNERLLGGRGYLGPVRLDKRTGVLELELDAELAVDPLVLDRANAKLASSGHRVGGLFNDWTLSAAKPDAAKPDADGLRSVRITDQKQGRLAITLGLDADKAGLVLWKMTTGAGFPVRLKWEVGPEGGRASGEVEIPIALGRRARHPLSVARGQLKNAGEAVASVAYVQVGDQFLFPKQPGWTVLLPKQSVALAEVFDVGTADLSRAVLPATAVAGEVHNPLDEFIQEDRLTDQLKVRNQLPAFDEQQKRTLRYVEVSVSQVQVTGNEEVVVARAGPFKLPPSESDFAERQVAFMKQGGKLRYRVEARAYFTDGVTDLRVEPVEGGEVNLAASMLKRP